MREIKLGRLKRFTYFTAMVFLTQHVFGQDIYLPLDEAGKKAAYADMAKSDQQADVIYKKVQQWVVKAFGVYENAVDQEVKEAGRLVIKSYVPVRSSVYDHLRFTMTVSCQDKKYQVHITDVEGISGLQNVVSLGWKENADIRYRSVEFEKETNRKKREEAEQKLKQVKADNQHVNEVLYGLMASLKEYVADNQAK